MKALKKKRFDNRQPSPSCKRTEGSETIMKNSHEHLDVQEYGIVHAYMKVCEEQNLQTPVRFRAPQQDKKNTCIMQVFFFGLMYELRKRPQAKPASFCYTTCLCNV